MGNGLGAPRKIDPEAAKEMRRQGHSLAEIARFFGVARNTAQHAVRGEPQTRTRWPNHDLKFDHGAAMDLVRQGMTMRAAARKMGVSVSRISQICREHGVKSLGKKGQADKVRDRVRAALRTGKDSDMVQAETGASRNMVKLIERELGLGKRRDNEERKALEYAPYVKMVLAGRSIGIVEEENDLPVGSLRYHMNKIGARGGKQQSAENASGYRFKLLPRLVAEGKTWREIGVECSQTEGRRLLGWSIRVWAKKHMPELSPPTRRGRPRKVSP